MSNMTIERIGQFMDNGNIENILERGHSVEQPLSPGVQNQAEVASGKSFGELLSDSINKANNIQLEADHAINELAAGRNKNIHETMLMLEKADTSFKLMMQVRNKIIDAYREIMRMQV